MRSPINLSDWVPGEGNRDPQESGAFTGFGTFSTDPLSGGIVDSRGAYNPAFNGQTQHPLFEAETDAFRSALPALARRARMGDANAAVAYQTFYGSLATRRKLYDMAYATGLNDRNATDIMVHVMDSVTPEKFGGGTDQFRTERVRYLAKQAQSRGVNASDLFASEQMMDDSFRSSFLSSLASATGITRAGGLKEQYGASDGMMANACLFLKKGLSDWEAKNGLRDDKTRMAVMSRAAEYYAKCLSNPGLRPLAGDAYSIVDAAASDSGTVAGVRGPNRFTDYTRAVNGLDRGFISYTGNPDGDRLAGYGADGERDGRTAAYWAIRDAYEKGYGANVAAGRLAREFDENTKEQLLADLESNFREVAPQAAAMEGYDGMIKSFVRDIAADGERGGIDLNKLSMKYYKDFKAPDAVPVEKALDFRADMQKFATDMADWGITYRPALSRTFGTSWTGDMPTVKVTGIEPQYDRAAIDKHVRSELDRLVQDPRFESIRGNEKFLGSIASMVSGYIGNANLVADPVAAGSGNADEYRKGIADRVNILYLAEELQRRGVDIGDWSPNVVGEDYQVRGNGKANLDGMYGQLSRKIGETLSRMGSDTSNLHGAELHNWHFLHNMQKGIDFLLKSAGEPDSKRSQDYRRLFDAYAGADGSSARKMADGAIALDRAKIIRELAPPAQGLSKEAAALAVLSDHMFSDTLNPVMADRARRFSAIKLGGSDYKFLDSQTKRLLADQYHLGVMTLMKQVMRAHPELPQSSWSDDDLMFKQLDSVSSPLFERAKSMSDALGAARQAELDIASARRVREAIVKKRETENEG